MAQPFDFTPYAVGGATRPDSFTGMNPEFNTALAQFLQAAPPEIQSHLKVGSGYRSPERQATLWAEALQKYGSAAEARKWVAPPGSSYHNKGSAADLKYLDPSAQEWAHANAEKFGLNFPLANENWHIELATNRSSSAHDHNHTAGDYEQPELTATVSTQGGGPNAPSKMEMIREALGGGGQGTARGAITRNQMLANTLLGAGERAMGTQTGSAPISGAAVLAGVLGDAGGMVFQNKAIAAEENRDRLLTEAMSGELTPERIAQIAELDPELGQSLLLQANKPQTSDLTSLQKNLMAAGYTPGTPEYQAAMQEQLKFQDQRPGAGSQTEFDKALGKAAAAAVTQMNDDADVASGEISRFDVLEDQINNLNTGTGAPAAQTVGQIMDYLGIEVADLPGPMQEAFNQLEINPDSASAMEVLNSVTAEGVTKMIGTGGFPANNFSDADRKFLMSIWPELKGTQLGNMQKLAILKAGKQKQIDKAAAWNAKQREIVATGKDPSRVDWEDFNQEWRDGAADGSQSIRSMMYEMTAQIDAGNGIAHVNSQEEFDALPMGTRFRNPETGRIMEKK